MIVLLTVTGFTSCNLFQSTVDHLFDGGFKLAPEIPVNKIDFEITGIGTEMRGYDSFPSITLSVTAYTPDGELITGMQEADFFDVIDDNGEARPITVTPRGATTSNRMADIVFVIDTTESMEDFLDSMETMVVPFVLSVLMSGTDYRLGFVTFGDDIRKGARERLAPTTCLDMFIGAVENLVAYDDEDDDPENQIDAIDYARASVEGSNPAGSFQKDMGFVYREEALKVFILITDADYHTPGELVSNVYDHYPEGVMNSVEDEIEKLNNDGVICYVVAPDEYGYLYESLAEETGGMLFDEEVGYDEIDTIIEDITTRGDYMITFMTNDFAPGKLHKIRIALHTSFGDAQDIEYYTSPPIVNYHRAMEIYERGLE